MAADTDRLDSEHPGVPIVGIGASAGGLEALQRFLSGLPAGLELATDARVGLEVVQALAEGSLSGRFSLINDHGCRAEITIPFS